MRRLIPSLLLASTLFACDGGDNPVDSDDTSDTDTSDTDTSDTDTSDTDTSDTDVADDTDPLFPYIDCRRNGTLDAGSSEVVHYNEDGRKMSRTYTNNNSTILETWEYAGDQLTTHTRTLSGNTITVEYTYDSSGHLISDTSGRTYTYDSQGRQTASTIDWNNDGTPEESCTRDWNTANTNYNYEETCSGTESETWVNSVLLDSSCNKVAERNTVRNTAFDGTVTDDATYTYEADCQAKFIDTVWEGPNAGGSTSEYTYNSLRQLDRHVYNGEFGGGEWTFTYTCGEDSDEASEAN